MKRMVSIMLKTSEIRSKEIINMSDGRRLGLISDVEVNMETGVVEAIIVPGAYKIRGLFGKGNEIIINWSDIKKIGADVILVDMVMP